MNTLDQRSTGEPESRVRLGGGATFATRSDRRRLSRAAILPAAALAVGALAVSGCGGGTSLQARGAAANAHLYGEGAHAGGRSVVVGCDRAVYGQLASSWRSPQHGTVIAGPIAWPYLSRDARMPRSMFAASPGFAAPVKALAVVNQGAGVILSIPARERARLSLDYTGPNLGRYRISDGASATTLRPCANAQGMVGPGGRTQFAGGFLVAGTQCAEIDVEPLASARKLRRYIPFGRSCTTHRG